MNNSFVAIDFETANSEYSSACEIGLVKVKDGLIVDKFYSLIRPPDNYYVKANILVHGINPEQTEDAPCFCDIWPKIKEFIGDYLLVAHNVSFDISILSQTLAHYSIKAPRYQCLCTYEIYGASLSETCEAFGIERLYHNALIDAEACALLFINHLKGIQADFSKVNTTKRSSLFDFTGHERIEGLFLKPDFEHGDSCCPFYKKKVVITGVFINFDRQEIAQILKDKGADIDTGVTERTDYIIAGNDPGPSKMRKYETLRLKGTGIKLLSESDFADIIRPNSNNL